MAEDRLTDEEVARVLRRAAELDPGSAPQEGGLPVAAVESAAAEVGLEPAAVRRAVAELRAGALDDVSGPRFVVCARVVPGEVEASLASVGRYLAGQAFVRARDRGNEEVWRPREDWLAGLRRTFDVAAAIRLKDVDEVVVHAVQVEGGTLVRLVARLQGAVAAAPAVGTGVGATVGGAGAGFLGLVTGDPALLFAVLGAVPGGAALGAVGWRVGRAARARGRGKVADALDGMLDELERGRQPGAGRALDKLAERARRVRGGYRL